MARRSAGRGKAETFFEHPHHPLRINLYAWVSRESVDREADAERVMTMLTEGLGLARAG